MATTIVREADYAADTDCAAIVDVLDSYASDPIGGGTPLPADVRERLVASLRDHPGVMVLLAFRGDRAVGIAVCFLAFSTFRALPVMNVHDLAVVPDCRGEGIGRALLGEVEARARGRGCCRMSLEVQEDNERAFGLYRSFGFRDVELGGESAATRFLTRSLEAEE